MNKPNKTELEYFIRYSLDSDKYKRYMELYDEIERLNNIISKAIKMLEESQKGLEEWHFDGYDPDLKEIIEILKGNEK